MDPSTTQGASDFNPDPATATSLLPLVYAELHAIASRYLRHERPDHTLQPTALVHEAYLRLRGRSDESDSADDGDSRKRWPDRAHFMAVAATAMRNVLVDHARRHLAAKRGEGRHLQRVTLESSELSARPSHASPLDVLELHDLLDRLARLDARRARVVELKVFAAMTNHEIADVLGVSRSTVADDWTVAKAWLAAELSES